VTTLAVLQPGYLPWLGFFDQMRRADVFVYYDDVQFDKHGWRNRNRIKCTQGVQWLSVPVHHRGRPSIAEVEIDNSRQWARKHLATLRQCYAAAPHLEPYLSELSDLLERPWVLLVDLDLALTALLAQWLEIRTPVALASQLGVGGSRTDRLVALCKHFGADRYRSGDAARSYLDVRAFEREGIAVEWQNLDHPVYPQLHGAFVSHLSVIDVILNCGELSRRILATA